MKTSSQSIAQILLDIGAVLLRPEQPFTLTSGKKSPVYVDCRKLISFPQERRLVMNAMADAVRHSPTFSSLKAIAGGETAGIPYAAWLAEILDLPMLYVRKKPKGFGRNAQIEGSFAEGNRVLLVEDLATDGGSKVVFVNALRESGAVVDDCIVVFYYNIFDYQKSPLAALNITLKGLATWEDILFLAAQQHLLSDVHLNSVQRFLENPDAWQQEIA
jgi:orotate phosphoribosyltransferase